MGYSAAFFLEKSSDQKYQKLAEIWMLPRMLTRQFKELHYYYYSHHLGVDPPPSKSLRVYAYPSFFASCLCYEQGERLGNTLWPFCQLCVSWPLPKSVCNEDLS